MLLTACVENLIHISVLSSGKYSIKYNSIGDKADLENHDFLHPENTDLIQWSSTMISLDKDSIRPDSLNWEKETIITRPINQKMSFTNSESLIYDIDVSKSKYFFGITTALILQSIA